MARKTKAQKDQELIGAVDSEIASAQNANSSELKDNRAKAMEYYLGEPYGDEKEGQSNVRTREVLDTIEWIKPELMKIFSGGGDTVRFEPEMPSDVEWAEQSTDYINYILNRKNKGFKILYQWITDGLLQKNGVVKAWWDNSISVVREDYKGLSEPELQMLVAPEEVEIVDQEITMGAEGPEYSVGILRSGPEAGIRIENIPPEEFIISKGAKCIEEAPLVAHVTQKSISQLREMGYKVPDDISSGGDADSYYGIERQARYSDIESDRASEESASNDPANRLVWYTEAYIEADYNNDGVAERRKVCKVGSTLFANDEVDCVPFAGWTPIMISHRYDGMSMADLVMDLQRIQSQLLRNVLNNQYLTNNGRYAVIDGMANMDDLLSSRAHGVVRMKMAGAVTRLDTPQLGQSAFQMLDYMDRLREKRTGVSERSQGLDQGQLGANQAASAVNQVMTAAQQRIELIARVFGETGLTDLFQLLYTLVIQNDTKKSVFRLRDKYIEVNPSEWKDKADTSVVVGLGNGSRESEMMQLQQIFQAQQQLTTNPKYDSIVTSSNVFNTVEDMVKVFNKASAGRHFTDPSSPEAQQAQQQAQQAAQAQQQQMSQMQAMQMEMEKQRLQIDKLKAEATAQYQDRTAAVKEGELQETIENNDDKVAVQTAELHMEFELEKEQGRGVSLGSN